MEKAELYIVATPIGTLQDLSPRAVEVLKNVDFIICEDTRHSGNLLKILQITTPTTSLHEHNEYDKSSKIIERLLNSPRKKAAIITDAGTPCISDPGSFFVNEAHTAGVQVLSVPGPSALPTALAASGFQAPRIVFSAFLGRSQKEKAEEFALWQSVGSCLAVFYESPQRIKITLKNMAEFFGDDLRICASKELSKRFETHFRGSIGEVIEKLMALDDTRGEWSVVALVPAPVKVVKTVDDVLKDLKEQLQRSDAPKAKQLCKRLASLYGVNASELYNLYLQEKE